MSTAPLNCLRADIQTHILSEAETPFFSPIQQAERSSPSLSLDRQLPPLTQIKKKKNGKRSTEDETADPGDPAVKWWLTADELSVNHGNLHYSAVCAGGSSQILYYGKKLPAPRCKNTKYKYLKFILKHSR